MALSEIVRTKRTEVAEKRERRPLEELARGLQPSDRSLEEALRRPGPSFILECKRASPSRGVIREAYDPGAIARSYAPFASAVSVLVDETYFGGSLDQIAEVRAVVSCPVLCKEIIVDPYQVYEARAAGADAVLLMASVLDDVSLRSCAEVARMLQLDVLAEVHDRDELARVVELGFPIVGINNRDLTTLEVDLETTRRLAGEVPDDRVVVSESGLAGHGDVVDLAAYCDAFLVGGALMARDDLDHAVRELVFGRVKVCGLTRRADAECAWRLGATDGGVILTRETDSPRRIDRTTAREIARSSPLRMTGVYVDDAVETIRGDVDFVGLSAVQLHGREGPEFIERLRSKLPSHVEIVDVARVGTELPAPTAGADRTLFDTFVPGIPGGTGESYAHELLAKISPEVLREEVAVAGGLGADNVATVARLAPAMIELNSRVEEAPGEKSAKRLDAALRAVRKLSTRSSVEVARPARRAGSFGAFGGRFVPEILVPALESLEAAFMEAKEDPEFDAELRRLLRDFAGRPTPLYRCDRLSEGLGATIVLKREDLLHGGAHKTNQVLAQALLARRLGKGRLIAETGAGQHGVATAMVGALFGMETVI